MRQSFKAAIGLCFLLTGGCYYAVIETGRPASGTTIEREWASSFVGGLVPPRIRDVARRCPSGAARVEAQHTVLNLLATWATLGLYSPVSVTVSCAAEERREQSSRSLT